MVPVYITLLHINLNIIYTNSVLKCLLLSETNGKKYKRGHAPRKSNLQRPKKQRISKSKYFCVMDYVFSLNYDKLYI